MKKIHLWSWLMLLVGLFPLSLQAQSYDELWQKVEANTKKDLPKSVIQVVDEIYVKAKEERNIPQMMKAYLVRTENRIALTPDSMRSEYEAMKKWAKEETDLVGRAVLNHILGVLSLDRNLGLEDEDVISYFRKSLQEKDLLGQTSAKSFRPMTVSGELSEKYFDDNMFDLLSRQAIRELSQYGYGRNEQYLAEALTIYDGLIAFYGDRNRKAALLTKEAKLLFICERMKSEQELREDNWAGEMYGLAETYKDLPEAADVYVKLTAYYMSQDSLAKAVSVAREGIRKYPKGEWKDILHKYIRGIMRPYLSVDVPFVYPKYNAEIKLRYANLKGVTLEFYRLNLSPSSSLLRGNIKYEELMAKYGKKSSEQTFSLAATPDYQQRDTVLHCALPPAGIYVMKQVPVGTKRGVDYTLLFVSPYQVVSVPVDDKHREMVAVDKLTGHPVPGAEIVVYQDKGNAYVLHKAYRTDSKGSAVILISSAGIRYNVRTQGNDFTPISWMGNYSSFVKQTDAKWIAKSELFTDRVLYRPGQTVHVSGLMYEQEGDSLRVRKNEQNTLKLYSLGYGDVAEFKVSTDEYGVLSGEFTLPSSLLPGVYYISSDASGGTSVQIRVEEYKRPTFDVGFVPYEGTYNMGDSVTLKGEAKTFAGAPVRLSKVKYTITRSERRWFGPVGMNKVQLASGETRTDAEGKFVVGVRLTAPERVEWEDNRRFYVYEVEAEVTSGTNETQKNSLSLSVGRQSLGLQIKGLESIVMREKQDKIQFMALNLNGQPVKTTIGYKVFALDDNGIKGQQKAEGKVESQHSFVPSVLLALPSGKYRIEVSATDDQGRLCTSEQDFMLFSAQDTRLPYREVCWFYQDGSEFNEDHSPVLYVGTSEKDVYLLVDVFSGDKRIDSQRLVLNDEIKSFAYPYRKEYGDGITVNFAFMRKGDLFSVQAAVRRPEPDKHLTLKWETFRDKLQPGTQEEWRVSITDCKGLPAKANLMATLYDASLDKIYLHNWNFKHWFYRSTPYISTTLLSAGQRVGLYGDFTYIFPQEGMDLLHGAYSTLYGISGRNYVRGMVSIASSGIISARANADKAVEVKYIPEGVVMDVEESATVPSQPTFNKKSGTAYMEEVVQIVENDAAVDMTEESPMNVPVRENFAETAFFYPNLRTDSLGNVSVVFTVPDALTEWKFMGLAHTQTVDYGLLTGKAVTSKQFMVQPNMPRFVRKGDRTVIAASLTNLSMETLEGNARIWLSDPMSGDVLYDYEVPFTVGEGETGTVRFECEIPEDYDVLVCKVMAQAGDYSDGEQHYLPVLSDKQWMTETVPVQLKGEDSLVVDTQDLFNRQSKTATGHRLTVELTANPEWYAVQALPVVGNPSDEDALSWATAFYANSLASAIVKTNPRIKQVFDAWMIQGDSKETLLSNLERNEDLKNLLLVETPWVAEAADETTRKQRIALLFDLNTMDNRQRTTIEHLKALQLEDGAWSWYKGMTASRYITTEIVEMLARLRGMGISLGADIDEMYGRAATYLRTEVQKEYERMRRAEKEGAKELTPDALVVRYLYICALDKRLAQQADRTINAYMTTKLENRSMAYSISEKSMIALIMQAAGKKRQAEELVQSVKEYTVGTPEMGIYFDTPKAAYSWSSYRIPAQVAAMEAIRSIAPDEDMIAGMKQWLLKQKQVQAWNTPVATANAVYAFLSGTECKLEAQGTMRAVVGGTEVQTPKDALGYIRRTFEDEAACTSQICVSRTGEGIGWGAVYAQYQEDMDKVLPAKGNGLSISREYRVNGKTLSRKAILKAGDKLTVRLTVTADRDMDFVRIKDERAACMESGSALSGYQWNGGLGTYRVNRDASTEFFVDRMPKGTYTLEYDVYLDRTGTYQAGAAIIQSVYAPEFCGHTAGQTLAVE